MDERTGKNPYPIGGMIRVDCRVLTTGTRPLPLSIKPAFRQGRSEVKKGHCQPLWLRSNGSFLDPLWLTLAQTMKRDEKKSNGSP